MPRSHFCTGASHKLQLPGSALTQPRRPACAALLPPEPGASPYKEVPGVQFQPIGLRLSPANWSCAASTYQSGSILANRGPGAGPSVYISQLPGPQEHISHAGLQGAALLQGCLTAMRFSQPRCSTVELLFPSLYPKSGI